MKDKLKNIPILGFLLRWFNNLLRLNNLRHTLFMEQQLTQEMRALIQEMQLTLQAQDSKINYLQEQNLIHLKSYQHIQDTIKYQLDRGISSTSITLYEKISAQLQELPKQKQPPKESIQAAILDDYYLSFEDRFRGSQKLITKRYEEYLIYLNPNIKKALDIGCGRGEWTHLLQQNSIDAHGIDLNASMLSAAQKRGVKNLQKADVFEFLNSSADNTYELITAFHVIEHIEFEKLFTLLEQISRVATPDATIILETPNPANLQVGAYTFYRDPTHLNPLPSEVISFMLEYIGFRDIEVHFLHPYPQEQHLQENSQSAKTLNQILYTNQDYLIKATNKKQKTQKTQKQILVDVSSIFANDLKTGIQRVVRSQIKSLIKLCPLDYTIQPVYLKEINGSYAYAYATSYTSNLLDIEFQMQDTLVKLKTADIFYGLDFAPHEVSLSTKSSLYKEYKSLGVKLYFMVYDLLPILNPNYFPAHMPSSHAIWLDDITDLADELICISQSVADELSLWLKSQNKPKLKISALHLGADIVKSKSQNIQKEPKLTFLMVGTIEPRKGHAEILEAFEILWSQDIDINLLIVGKKGWDMDSFLAKLNSHPFLDKNLFYYQDSDDEKLSHLYQTSHALILASQAEGFGLPLVEAAQYKLPIITRDIPVFHEVASTYAYYFPNTTNPQTIAKSLQEWLELYKTNKHPASSDMPWLTWEQNAQKLLEIFTQ